MIECIWRIFLFVFKLPEQNKNKSNYFYFLEAVYMSFHLGAK